MLLMVYRFIETKWFLLPEKLRFLLVGGTNTILSYMVLNILNIVFNKYSNMSIVLAANISLILQYIITINISFVTMRYYVFRSNGLLIVEWLKCLLVYIFMYIFNAFFMTFLMLLLDYQVWLVQLIYLIVSTLLIFGLHKFFSFRTIKNNLSIT